MWWVPALIFVLAFIGGVLAAARWLPELASGPVGGLAFFAVCGLIGAAVGLTGMHIYSTVRELEELSGNGVFSSKGDVLADGISAILYESGVLFAAAVAVFLLAPRESSAGAEPLPPAR